MKRFLSFIGLLFCAIACKNTSAPATGQIIAQQEITNQIYFAAKPIVSAHRGGGGEGLKGYPENCLESIQYLSSKGVHSFEIDIFESADGDLLLMHDNSLGRTATGKGEVSAMPTADLLKENLKDEFGNVTQQAKALYKVAPEMLLSVSVRNNDELERILQTGIPKEKLVAFTGIKVAPDALYQRLNELKIPAILGTLGNLDKRAAAKGDHLYKEWAQKGIQIFSTDRPLSLSF